MSRFLPLLLAALLGAGAHPAFAKAERYEFDKPHTRILFFISHSGFSHMVGEFRDYSGGFTLDEDTPENSSVDVTVNVKSVDTRSDKLNEHLQGTDFFDTQTYPTATFKSTKIERTGGDTAAMTGDLTLHGVTKPITFEVVKNKIGEHPVTKNTIAGFTAQATFNRSDFGMNYGLPDLIGDEVRLHIEVEGINMDRLPGMDRPAATKEPS